MSYISNNDIETRVGPAAYVQLADDNGDATADAAVVDEIRGAAEGEVNSFLAARYETPIDLVLHSELGELLKSIALDIAEYRLRSRRPPAPEEAIRQYRQTLDWLGLIAKGVIVLPSLTPVVSTGSRGLIAATTGQTRLLTRDELEAS